MRKTRQVWWLREKMCTPRASLFLMPMMPLKKQQGRFADSRTNDFNPTLRIGLWRKDLHLRSMDQADGRRSLGDRVLTGGEFRDHDWCDCSPIGKEYHTDRQLSLPWDPQSLMACRSGTMSGHHENIRKWPWRKSEKPASSDLLENYAAAEEAKCWRTEPIVWIVNIVLS